MSTRVVLLEDEKMLESLLSEWVTQQSDMELCRAFTSGQEFLETALTWAPVTDVMIIDIRLPDGDGIDLAAEACRVTGRQIPVVVLSGRAHLEDVARMRDNSDSGWSFITKGSNGLRHLRSAMDAALTGMVMIDPHVRNSVSVPAAVASLTDQERAILGSVAMGHSNLVIAQQHFLSVKSVERIISSIYEKFGVNSNTKAANPRVLVTLRYLGL